MNASESSIRSLGKLRSMISIGTRTIEWLRARSVAVTYVRRGGAEAVVYKINEENVTHGVEFGDLFFPGFPHPGDPSRQVAFYDGLESLFQKLFEFRPQDQPGPTITVYKNPMHIIPFHIIATSIEALFRKWRYQWNGMICWQIVMDACSSYWRMCLMDLQIKI